MPEKLIVYACPVGTLADQLDAYFAAAWQRCGANTAHCYPPHCTLTGFFRDELAAAGVYIEQLSAVLHEAYQRRPTPVIEITGMYCTPHFHYLKLESPWLHECISNFAARAESPTRQEALRVKDWYHLSLAYEFPPEQHEPLRDLAERYVDPAAAVEWELRFYHQHAGGAWTCLHAWPLFSTLAR